MSYYVFRLDSFLVRVPRNKPEDDDVVTFNVKVNQVDRGHGSQIFFGMRSSPTPVPVAVLAPNNARNMNRFWEIGPIEIRPTDAVHIVYSATNIQDFRDLGLQTQQQDEIELKILNTLVSSGVGTIGGPVGALAGFVIGLFSDFVGSILGYEAPSRCNGIVFADEVLFTGGALQELSLSSLPPPMYGTPLQPGVRFTRSYTDELSHNSACGDIALTDVIFSILKPVVVSVRSLLVSRFPNSMPEHGLRSVGISGSLKMALDIIH